MVGMDVDSLILAVVVLLYGCCDCSQLSLIVVRGNGRQATVPSPLVVQASKGWNSQVHPLPDLLRGKDNRGIEGEGRKVPTSTTSLCLDFIHFPSFRSRPRKVM